MSKSVKVLFEFGTIYGREFGCFTLTESLLEKLRRMQTSYPYGVSRVRMRIDVPIMFLVRRKSFLKHFKPILSVTPYAIPNPELVESSQRAKTNGILYVERSGRVSMEAFLPTDEDNVVQHYGCGIGTITQLSRLLQRPN